MCNNVIINRLKTLKRWAHDKDGFDDIYFVENPEKGIWVDWEDIQEIIDEFEVKDHEE